MRTQGLVARLHLWIALIVCHVAVAVAVVVVVSLSSAMQGIMADLPQSCIDDPDGSISAVLWQLFRLAPTLFHTWMAAAMAAVIPESIITKAVQATFLTELMKSASERKFAQLLYDLSDTGYSMRK